MAGQKKVSLTVRDPALADDAGRELAARRAQVPDTAAERLVAVRAGLHGDRKAEALAVACVRAHPGEFPLQYGRSVSAVMDRISDGNKVLREVLAQEVSAKWRELRGGDTPAPPLEEMLIDRVLACWMHLGDVQRWYDSRWEKGGSLQQAAFWEKRLESVHRQYLSSVKALAQVRRLGLPAIQVNVAEQQVNVAAPGVMQQNGCAAGAGAGTAGPAEALEALT